MAFELSIFDDIKSVSGLIYGRTKIFLSKFEFISIFVVPNEVSVLCTNNFFSLELILLNINSKGYYANVRVSRDVVDLIVLNQVNRVKASTITSTCLYLWSVACKEPK